MGNNFLEIIANILKDGDPFVRGAVAGLLGAVVIAPSTFVAVTRVNGVIDAKSNTVYDGYVLSVINNVSDANTTDDDALNFSEMSKTALLQRFIGLDDDGKAVLFCEYGVSEADPISAYIN